MKKFQVELTARIIGFMEITVEADSEDEAKRQALQDAAKASLHDWDIQYVEYYGDKNEYQQIEVNDIRELSETAT